MKANLLLYTDCINAHQDTKIKSLIQSDIHLLHDKNKASPAGYFLSLVKRLQAKKKKNLPNSTLAKKVKTSKKFKGIFFG